MQIYYLLLSLKKKCFETTCNPKYSDYEIRYNNFYNMYILVYYITVFSLHNISQSFNLLIRLISFIQNLAVQMETIDIINLYCSKKEC